MGHCLFLILLPQVSSKSRVPMIILTADPLDKALQGVPRSKIRDQLTEVGFDNARQADVVGGLSGGWKMKLELARAMLYNADLLLLDEVCTQFRFGIADRSVFFHSQPITCAYFKILMTLSHLLHLLQLDRASVKWLEEYLKSQKNVTCLIVSHDSG